MQEILRASRECLILIPEIARHIHLQYIHTSANEIIELTERLGVILQAIGEDERYGEYVDPLTDVLEVFVSAQERKDYRFLADILVDDLQVLLRLIHRDLMEEKEAGEYEDYFQRNLAYLKKEQANLYRELEQREDVSEDFVVVPALNGQLSGKYVGRGLEICMHSMVDPESEAMEFAREQQSDDIVEYYVYGMGLGYHVRALLEQGKRIRVVVLESNWRILCAALKYCDLTSYLSEERLRIVYNDEIETLLGQISSNIIFLVHYPSLQILPESRARELLENYFISASSMNEQRASMDDNFYRLQEAHLPEGSERLEDVIRGSVLAIVAAGPSAEKEIQALKSNRREVCILAVGTVAYKLIQNGLKPDFILITDAWKEMYRQVDGIEGDIPLMLLSTASADILGYYSGPIYLLYQNGYLKAERTAEEEGYPLYDTGGSVTTLALDIGIRHKAAKIILVGTDMAYTGNVSHAFGLGKDIRLGTAAKRTEGVGGGTVITGRNLDIYRKWIENRISRGEKIPVYNTAHGARIAGTIEMNVEQALNDV